MYPTLDMAVHDVKRLMLSSELLYVKLLLLRRLNFLIVLLNPGKLYARMFIQARFPVLLHSRPFSQTNILILLVRTVYVDLSCLWSLTRGWPCHNKQFNPVYVSIYLSVCTSLFQPFPHLMT